MTAVWPKSKQLELRAKRKRPSLRYVLELERRHILALAKIEKLESVIRRAFTPTERGQGS